MVGGMRTGDKGWRGGRW